MERDGFPLTKKNNKLNGDLLVPTMQYSSAIVSKTKDEEDAGLNIYDTVSSCKE